MPGQGYQWDARDYREWSSQQKKWGRELLARLHLEGNEHVLDIGCGDGLVTAELAARLPRGRVLGIDISPHMISLARETFPPEEYPNLSWEVMDAREMTFRESFHVAFSNAVLHWIPEQQAVLEGVWRALKPGGRVHFEMGGRGNAARVAMAMISVMGRPRWNGYFRDFRAPYTFWDRDEYLGMLIDAGFQPLRVELVPKDMVHRGREGLAAWIRTTWLPFTQRIPEGERESFIGEIVDGYLAESPPDEEGLVHVEAVRLEVEAVKP